MMIFARFVYFLSHPSDYIGVWTLDLTFATVLFSVVTLGVVLRQLSLMAEQTRLMIHQDNLMQRQTDVVVRQDETNRELMSRRVRLRMYMEGPSAQVAVFCRNDGNKTAQNFYWHLAVPATVAPLHVRDGLGNEVLTFTRGEFHEDVQCRHYSGLVPEPLYPTRVNPVARITATDPELGLWWSTISEDGADPTPDGKMQRMNCEEGRS
jgi:hypothetical protein